MCGRLGARVCNKTTLDKTNTRRILRGPMHSNMFNSTVYPARLMERARVVGGRLNGDGPACAREMLGLDIELTD